jgi:hypothetical protein
MNNAVPQWLLIHPYDQSNLSHHSIFYVIISLDTPEIPSYGSSSINILLSCSSYLLTGHEVFHWWVDDPIIEVSIMIWKILWSTTISPVGSSFYEI